MFRSIGAAAAVSTILALAACSDSADEPAGLTGDSTTAPDATDSAAPSETPEVSEPDSPESDSNETNPEPTSTFTQPYLPEERVVELRDTVPVELPADATDDETAVVTAFQHVQASWEQILWGVPFEQTGIERYSTGEHLDTMRDYAEESVELQRVSLGPPMPQHLLSVEADAETATVKFCVDSSGWADVSEGSPPKFDDELYLGTMTFEVVEGAWKSSRVEYADDVSPCEGVFS